MAWGARNLISTQVRAAELFPSEGSREEEEGAPAHACLGRIRSQRARRSTDPGLLPCDSRVRDSLSDAVDATLCDAGKYTKKLKNLAAEAKKRANDEKLAAVWKYISESGGSVDGVEVDATQHKREILISTQGGREESRPRRGESES